MCGRPECGACFQPEPSSSSGVNTNQMVYPDCVSCSPPPPSSGIPNWRPNRENQTQLEMTSSPSSQPTSRTPNQTPTPVGCSFHFLPFACSLTALSSDDHGPPLGRSRVQYLRPALADTVCWPTHDSEVTSLNPSTAFHAFLCCVTGVFSSGERFVQSPEEAG